VDVTRVKATIGQGTEAAGDGAAVMSGVRDKIGQAQALATETTRGSSHDELDAGMEKLKEALKESTRVIGLLRTSAHAAGRYAARI
jgi:hypothetical protein